MTSTGDRGTTRWSRVSGGLESARAYQERLDQRLREGADLDGEARFVDTRTTGTARILDAGCGTGRIAATLSGMGHDVLGVDADPGMIQVAREHHEGTSFAHADLSDLTLSGPPFDIVLLAGNVVPYLADGTLETVLERLAAHLVTDGRLIAGWSLPGHQPGGAADVSLEDYDAAATAAGLEATEQYSTWDAAPWPGNGAYALTVHQRR